MKKTLHILLAALFVACSSGDETVVNIPDGMGLMRFDLEVSDQVEISSSTRASDILYIPSELVPTEDDLDLKIYQMSYDTNNELTYDLYLEYTSITEYNDLFDDEDSDSTLTKSPYLPAGDYFALVSNGVDIEVESEVNAYFADSVGFTIIARDTEESTKMRIMLQNSVIRLQLTDIFKSYFAGGGKITLSTESENEITIEYPSTNEDEVLLYVMPNTNLYISGSATKQDPGTGTAPTTTFTKSLVGIATKSQLTTVIVDAEQAGSGSITVTIDDQITLIEEQIIDLHN